MKPNSEILAMRIDSELLDYIRQQAQNESRTIAKQIRHILMAHKNRMETLKQIQKGLKGK